MKPTLTLSETMNLFSTEESCKKYLQERRWPNGTPSEGFCMPFPVIPFRMLPSM